MRSLLVAAQIAAYILLHQENLGSQLNLMIRQIELDIEKQYSFPDNIEIIHYGEVYIVIAVDTACWIVLDNEDQLAFFKLLKDQPIKLALDNFKGNIKNAQWVLIQIEARQLCSDECFPFKEEVCMIYLTNECNLRCPHCFISAGIAKQSEMTTKEIIELIDNLADNGIREITFSGGEVALHEGLSDIVDHAFHCGIAVRLLTNGVLWDERKVDEIANKISSVQISIDGFSEEENSKMRGHGNFEKALKTVDLFMKSGVKTQIAMTPYPDDSLTDKVRDYAKFAKDMKSKYDNSNQIKIVFTSGFMDGRDISLTKQQKDRYRDTMNNVMKAYLEEDAGDYPFILDHQQRKIMTNCSYGCLNISSDGNVYICSRTGLKPVANVRTHSVNEIMEISHQAAALSEINNLEPCRKCCLKYICGGGCRIDEFPSMSTGPYSLEDVPTRDCNESVKKEFYELMIRTNEKIFQ